MKKALPFLLVLVLFVACTTEEARFNREIAEIEDYIATTGLDFTQTPSGLFYHILDTGNVIEFQTVRTRLVSNMLVIY